MLQHPWTMCHHYVWCDSSIDLQECSNLAPWSLPVCAGCHGFLNECWKYCAEIHVTWVFCFFPTSVFVKTSQSCFVATRLMSRTGRWRQSKLHSTGRRICSTMKSQQRVITTSRSLSCTLPGSLLGVYSDLSNLFVIIPHCSTIGMTCFNLFLGCSDPSLHFVESPALAPPEVQIDLVAQQQ